MIQLNNIRKIYFIGIGGIGMSALARYFTFHGKDVSGYDKTETPLTKELINEGIPVHYEDDLSLIPKDAELIVYTPAVPKDHVGLSFFQQNDYPVFKRSDVLGMITLSSFNICVAGTHGKTTVSTMIAHVLRHSDFGCNAFLGGIAVNYNTGKLEYPPTPITASGLKELTIRRTWKKLLMILNGNQIFLIKELLLNPSISMPRI